LQCQSSHACGDDHIRPTGPGVEYPYRGEQHGKVSKHDLRRLQFIRKCRNLGFTLDQIRELLRLSSNSQHRCSEVDRIAAAHLSEIEDKISDLQQLAAKLRHIGARCKGRGRIGNCRIIEALSS